LPGGSNPKNRERGWGRGRGEAGRRGAIFGDRGSYNFRWEMLRQKILDPAGRQGFNAADDFELHRARAAIRYPPSAPTRKVSRKPPPESRPARASSDPPAPRSNAQYDLMPVLDRCTRPVVMPPADV
jgi:hypothetical protein